MAFIEDDEPKDVEAASEEDEDGDDAGAGLAQLLQAGHHGGGPEDAAAPGLFRRPLSKVTLEPGDEEDDDDRNLDAVEGIAAPPQAEGPPPTATPPPSGGAHEHPSLLLHDGSTAPPTGGRRGGGSHHDNQPTKAVLAATGGVPAKPAPGPPRRWSAREDTRLLMAYLQCRGRDWKAIAATVGNDRNHYQARQRYLNIVEPALKQRRWLADETKVVRAELTACQRERRPVHWVTLSTLLPFRSATDVENRYKRGGELDAELDETARFAKHKVPRVMAQWYHLGGDADGRPAQGPAGGLGGPPPSAGPSSWPPAAARSFDRSSTSRMIPAPFTEGLVAPAVVPALWTTTTTLAPPPPPGAVPPLTTTTTTTPGQSAETAIIPYAVDDGAARLLGRGSDGLFEANCVELRLRGAELFALADKTAPAGPASWDAAMPAH